MVRLYILGSIHFQVSLFRNAQAKEPVLSISVTTGRDSCQVSHRTSRFIVEEFEREKRITEATQQHLSFLLHCSENFRPNLPTERFRHRSRMPRRPRSGVCHRSLRVLHMGEVRRRPRADE